MDILELIDYEVKKLNDFKNILKTKNINNIICNEKINIFFDKYYSISEDESKSDLNCKNHSNLLLYICKNFYDLLIYGTNNNIYNKLYTIYENYLILINDILKLDININFINEEGFSYFTYVFLLNTFNVGLQIPLNTNNIFIDSTSIPKNLLNYLNENNDNFLNYLLLYLETNECNENIINQINILINLISEDNIYILTRKNNYNKTLLELSISKYGNLFFYKFLDIISKYNIKINDFQNKNFTLNMKKNLYKIINPSGSYLIYSKFENFELETFELFRTEDYKIKINTLDVNGNNFLFLLLIKIILYLVCPIKYSSFNIENITYLCLFLINENIIDLTIINKSDTDLNKLIHTIHLLNKSINNLSINNLLSYFTFNSENIDESINELTISKIINYYF